MDERPTPEALAEQAQHAVELLELGDAFFELDPEWRIIRVNQNQERLSRKPREETLGRVFWEVWPETADPAGPYWREYHRCMEQRVPVQFEAHFEPLDLWTGVTAYPVSSGGIAVFFRDVSAVKRAEMQATRRAAEVEAVLSSVADGVVVYDREGRILRANDAARAMLGYTPAEAALPIRDRLASGGAQWFTERGEPLAIDDLPAVRAARRGETHRGIVLRVRKDGVDKWLRISAAPLRVGEAQTGSVVSLADITARKLADEASASEHELLVRLFERLPVMITMYDPKLGRFRFNAAFKERLGWTEADAAAGDLMALAYPDPAARAAAAEHMSTLAPGWREFSVTAKGGSVVPSAWANLRLSDDTLVGIGIDLRERKAADRALRESEARLRRMIDANPIGVVNRDVSGRVRYANDAYLRIIRASREDLEAGRVRWDVITDSEHRARDAAAMKEAKQAGVSSIFEKEYLLPDGTRVPVLVAFASMGTAGELTAFVVDITDRKRSEEALRASEERLRKANEQLREADRRKNEFLGMLSHELRNPLAPVRNALYILERSEPAGPQARRAREIVNRQVTHITRLVDDLLDVTRIARGKIDLRRADLDVAALARRSAEDHRPLLVERGLELVVDVPPHRLIVNGDETRLAQVFGNLLHNAAKFTPAGGRVTLSVRAEEGNAVVHVRDTGAGIDAAAMRTIFEPFTQAEQTLARSEGGLGLGLALVKGLVTLHGGDVIATSAGAGRGTDFAVSLPLVTRATARERTSPPAATAVRLHRVLIVDDNHDAAETLADLVRMLGHEVEVAYDGRTAVALARAHGHDLVLCDIGLPGIDGYEVARQLRAAGATDVRLVAVSGYAQPDDVARALQAGFDDHVAKPPDPDRLAGLLS